MNRKKFKESVDAAVKKLQDLPFDPQPVALTPGQIELREFIKQYRAEARYVYFEEDGSMVFPNLGMMKIKSDPSDNILS